MGKYQKDYGISKSDYVDRTKGVDREQDMFEFDDLLECLQPSYELFGVVAREQIYSGNPAYVSYVRKNTKFPIETGALI